MIIFTLRRLLLLLITLLLLLLVGFSLCYYTPNAPLGGATLFDAYGFFMRSLTRGDLGISSMEVIRLMRISTTDVFSKNYVKAAATRGLSRLTIIRRHVLRNALPPITPQLGLQFSTMLTLAIITEVVFSWPGLGRWLVDAIRQQDYSAISAGVMVVGAMVITVNVLSDIWGAMANSLKHKEWYALR